MLSAKYPECGLILGADKNNMDICPILNCGLRLRQVVSQFTRLDATLDIIILNLSGLYNSPVIVPPLQPDDPSKGKSSDHSVPVCTPHTDRYRPARRDYKIVNYRPLPDSSVLKFGSWIVSEKWDSVTGCPLKLWTPGSSKRLSPSEQTIEFEKLVNNKLNQFCPTKQMKLGSQDKAFITKEI